MDNVGVACSINVSVISVAAEADFICVDLRLADVIPAHDNRLIVYYLVFIYILC